MGVQAETKKEKRWEVNDGKVRHDGIKERCNDETSDRRTSKNTSAAIYD